MFSKSKGEKAKKRHVDSNGKQTKPSLSQLGLLEIPNVSDLALGGATNDDDDAALEAELLLLTGGKRPHKPKKAKSAAPGDLDKMVAECMNEDYEDEPIDEDDPELLAELSALGPEEDDSDTASRSASPSLDRSDQTPSPPKKPAPSIVRPSPFVAGSSVANLLKERIQMYKEAEDNALATGDTSRAKRFTRGLKTMNQMLKQVNAGVAVNEEDIPPHVLIRSSRNNSARDLSEQQTPGDSSPSFPVPSTIPQHVAFSSPVDNSVLKPRSNENIPRLPLNEEDKPPSPVLPSILKRQQEYKMAALTAKKDGDREAAVNFMRTAKQLDPLVQAAKEGQTVDLDSLPPPPSEAPAPPLRAAPPVPSRGSNDGVPVAVVDSSPQAPPQEAPPAVSAAPSTPTSVLEALEQRLARYTEQRDKAKAQEDSRKERMNQRIMKQFQDAIKAHKAGRAVNYEELPTPPGFPPLPTGAPPPPATAASAPAPHQPQQKTVAQGTPTAQNTQQNQSRPAVAVKPQPPVKPDVRKAPQSRVERQLSVLQRRQDQFKAAALEAKKRGEVEQAKEYLRNYKGFDQLIAVTHGGLPVDMNTVPIPPQDKLGSMNTSLDFEIVDQEDCVFAPPETEADVALAFTKLEDDLIAQIKMCAHTREHFKALGDVASANRFEQLILHTKKDLDAVRVAFKRGDKPPRFHYENRSFTMIQCNTDLKDSDCEVTVVRGINFNVSNPEDVDTCVRIEFPYPNDAPPQERSNVVKGTNNPEFNHKIIFSIDRKARALARVFKRHFIKCQIVTKGGWFHRDSVLGIVKVPLVPLETKCTLHESFDLMDEKKKMVGGKLEVKLRVRNPILSKQLEKVNEKWVVIDGF